MITKRILLASGILFSVIGSSLGLVEVLQLQLSRQARWPPSYTRALHRAVLSNLHHLRGR